MAQNRYYSSTALPTVITDVGGISDSATTINIASASGLPVSFPYTMLIEWGTSNAEVVTVTNRTSLVLTVTRADDGTTGKAHAQGAYLVHGVSKRDFDEAQAHIAATTGHGATGAVVGTTNTQTLSNKSLDSSSAILISPRMGDVVNVKNYGALGDGSTDDTAAIQLAITALGAAGGTVLFPRATFNYTQLNVSTLANIWFKGLGGPASGGTRGSVLNCTVTGGAGGINAQNTNGFHLENMVMTHTGGFTGYHLDLSNPAGSDTSYFSVERNLFKGVTTASGIYMNKANDGFVSSNHFQGGVYNILGQAQDGTGYSNGVVIDKNVFHVGTGTIAHIGGVGGGYTIQGNVFEDIGSNGSIYNADTVAATLCTGVVISGNWFGDVVGSPTTFCVALTFQGLSVVGNFMGWKGVDIRGTSIGASIKANHIQTCEVSGINVTGTIKDYDFTGNQFFASDKTTHITPAGTGLVNTQTPIVGPAYTIHNPNVGSGDGRSIMRISSDRGTTVKWDFGIDTGGGSGKSFGIKQASSGSEYFNITSLGSVILGSQAALSTSATDGFVYLPTSAGTPSGTPTGATGKVAYEVDTTNHIPYFYDGGWKAVVTAAATQTLTNKTLTSPAITTPTGIVKGDVGLGNVDNTSDATKNAAAVTLTNKTITAPVISTVVNTGTITFPTVTGTLATLSGTETFNNKTLNSAVMNSSQINGYEDWVVQGAPGTPLSGLSRLYITSTGPKVKADTGVESAYVLDTATQTLTNKTLTTPTIGSFTNAQHDHSNAAGGGTLNVSAAVLTSGTVSDARLPAQAKGRNNLAAVSNVLAWTYDPALLQSTGASVKTNATGGTPTLGQIQLMRIYLFAGDVCTTMAMMAGDVAVASGTNFYFALYSVSGTTATQVAVTASMSSTTINTLVATNFVTPFTVITSGFYYLAFSIGNSTGAPTMFRSGQINGNPTVGAAGTYRASHIATLNGDTTLPSTVTISNNPDSQVWWAQIY